MPFKNNPGCCFCDGIIPPDPPPGTCACSDTPLSVVVQLTGHPTSAFNRYYRLTKTVNDCQWQGRFLIDGNTWTFTLYSTYGSGASDTDVVLTLTSSTGPTEEPVFSTQILSTTSFACCSVLNGELLALESTVSGTYTWTVGVVEATIIDADCDATDACSSVCSVGNTPKFFQVTFSADPTANNDCFYDCDDLATGGPWLFYQNPISPCDYTTDDPRRVGTPPVPADCTIRDIGFSIYSDGLGNVIVLLGLGRTKCGTGVVQTYWLGSLGVSPIDCSSISVTLDYDSQFSTNDCCEDYDTITVDILAL